MSENLAPTPEKPVENPDRWRNLVIILTILTTVFAAVLAALQADASIRSSIANRDSQYYAVVASGELIRSGLASNYEFVVYGQVLRDMQEATVFQLTALEQQGRGEDDLAKSTLAQADAAQARTNTGNKFSVFNTDPRYAPKAEGELPQAEAYLKDANAKANELVASQNQAADDYKLWNNKSDAYVTILTVLAVAFFMFGVAQAIKVTRMRLVFTIFGSLVVLLCGAWTLLVLIS
jgi:hypothetical protein